MPLRHDQRVFLLGLAAGLPGSGVALVLLWTGDFALRTQWTLTLFITVLWWIAAAVLRHRVVFPLQTLANLLEALREGDFSIRGRGAGRDDPLGDVLREVNALGDTLREQRLGAVEATALLRTVMAEIEVAVFAFDETQRLRLVNRAGERLLGRPEEQLLTRSAGELGLAECLVDTTPRVLPVVFPGGSGRWELRRGRFRQGGRPHELVVLSDVSQPLRDQEREAWQRLIRVIGHELNNSLAPIRSIAGSLDSLLTRDPPPEDWRDDMRRGLGVITGRTEALGRFTAAYSTLARLPKPERRAVNLPELLQRVVSLETRAAVRLCDGKPVLIQADPDQLEQLFINLVRNAVDAALETGGGVQLSWERTARRVRVYVDDAGPGLANTANLFVPFFTTKPAGTGIGLVLCRQIAEAHGGTVSLADRRDTHGCRATVNLPIAA
jgi:nitrogen fixation/metabolism regulation signal transduction histidine kinase